MKRVTNQTVDLSGLESGQADIEVKIDAIKTDTESIENKTDAVSSKCDSIQSDIAIIDGKCDNIQSDIVIVDGVCDLIKTDTTNIESKVDALIASISAIETKIDIIETETIEIENHLHSYSRKFGKAISPNGEIHVADRIGPGVASFQINAGNNTWGSWTQILGSSDTPAIAGKSYYDFHIIHAEATQRAATYFFQFAFGESAAAALSTNDCSDNIYQAASNLIDSGPTDFRSKKQVSGTKSWVRCMVPGEASGTFNFYLSLHEYD